MIYCSLFFGSDGNCSQISASCNVVVVGCANTVPALLCLIDLEYERYNNIRLPIRETK